MKKAQAPDYKATLLDELRKRQSKNPRYSLRSFARDLNILPSRLSAVTRGEYGLSPHAASEIAVKLKLDERDQANFVQSVITTADSKRLQRAHFKKIAPIYQKLSDDEFKYVADWYHFAILELPALKSFKANPEWIAKKLGITVYEADEALKRLQRMNLIRISGNKFKATSERTTTTTEVPSVALKTFHSQLIQRAEHALYQQSLNQRMVVSSLFAIKKSKIPAAKKMIEDFNAKFGEKFGANGAKDAIYCIGIQFFDLTADNTQQDSI